MLDFLKDDFCILVNVKSGRNDTAVVIDLSRKETRWLQKRLHLDEKRNKLKTFEEML